MKFNQKFKKKLYFGIAVLLSLFLLVIILTFFYAIHQYVHDPD